MPLIFSSKSLFEYVPPWFFFSWVRSAGFVFIAAAAGPSPCPVLPWQGEQ